MKITITPEMLCELCSPTFTLEACEALCEWFEETAGADFAPHIGDICISYAELEAEDLDEDDEEKVVARLENDNVLIAR